MGKGSVINVHQRNEYIDIVKSFLISAVVLGHVFVRFFPEEYIFRLDFRIIYSFHMFLFIFVSGYLVDFVGHEIDMAWVRKRFLRLMLPYFIWTIVLVLRGGQVSARGYFMELIAPSFWFLIILFLCDMMYCFVKKVFVADRHKLYAAGAVSFLVMLLWWKTRNMLGTSNILHMYSIYLPFYFLGIFSSIYKPKILVLIKRYEAFA